MKHIYLVIVLILSVHFINAQETATYTHYHLFPVFINPAAAGMHEQHEFVFNFRNRWSAFEGAPKNISLLYNGLVTDRIGLGGRLYSERIGQLRKVQGQVDYAYKFNLQDYIMSIGLSTAIQQFRIASITDDPFINISDPLLNEALDGSLLFDASVGIFGQYQESFYFGVSFPNLIRSRLADIEGEDDTIEDDEFNYTVLIGYRFPVKGYNFNVEPSLLIQNVRYVPFQLDLNLKLSFLEEQLIGGISYSISEENRFGVLIGTRINALRLYYSYDVSFGDFQNYNNGSHEFTVNYRLAKAQPSAEAEMAK